ncbi:MAG: phosphotransferase [bacterium]|nr:phosphotransferase [bacterium]
MLYPKEKLEQELERLRQKDLQVLLAVEQGMKSYEYVPKDYIVRKTGIDEKRIDYLLVELVDRGLLKILKTRNYVGFQLTYLAYDLLAITFFQKQGKLARVGEYIETGKEADILSAELPEGKEAVLKLYHIGRTSFYRVWRRRLYVVDRQITSWLYVSYLAARREHEITGKIVAAGFPAARPLAWNRNALLYEKLEAKELARVRLSRPKKLLEEVLSTYAQIVHDLGYVHGDFNIFNVLVDKDENFYIIDWGQALHINDPGAKEILVKEIEEFLDFFKRKYKIEVSKDRVYEMFGLNFRGIDNYNIS